MRVRSYKAKRGNKTVQVSAHEKSEGRFRTVKSSCIDRIGEGADGKMVITIRGREYPYPELPNNRVSGVISAESAGRYYNKHIRGRYF